jgi:polyisoprenoid-binding protein YceI
MENNILKVKQFNTSIMEATTKWVLDPIHSEVQFKVKHLVISTVSGFFRKIKGTIMVENDDFNGGLIDFSLDADSIDTNHADRDQHLRGPEFFDAANYPQITFKSTSFKRKTGEEYELTGDLTIKGLTKQVSLDVIHGGTTIDFYGETRAGFEISGKINRTAYGLNWAAKTQAGTLVIGEDIKLAIFAEFTKQK